MKTPPSLNTPFRKADRELPKPDTRTADGKYIRDRLVYQTVGLNRQQRRQREAIDRG